MTDSDIAQFENNGRPSNPYPGDPVTGKSPSDILFNYLMEYTDEMKLGQPNVHAILFRSPSNILITSFSKKTYERLKDNNSVVIAPVGNRDERVVAFIYPNLSSNTTIQYNLPEKV